MSFDAASNHQSELEKVVQFNKKLCAAVMASVKLQLPIQVEVVSGGEDEDVMIGKSAVKLSRALYQLLLKGQVEQRQAELTRLQQVLTAKIRQTAPNGDRRDMATRLGWVMVADPEKPLLQQLGFNPESVV